MTQQEFEQHRQTWIKEWNDKWRLLDIDFETYMLMKGMSPDEYKKMRQVGIKTSLLMMSGVKPLYEKNRLARG
jgi:hypothetical protein